MTTTPDINVDDVPPAHAHMTGYLVAQLKDGVAPADLIDALYDNWRAMRTLYTPEDDNGEEGL